MKSCWIAILGLLTVSIYADDEHVKLLPLKSGASLYFGQMFNIEDSLQQGDSFNPTVTLPTTSLWMVQEAMAGDRLRFSLGIAGTFWYPFPESNVAGQGWTSYRTGGVAISQAVGTYSLGELKNPWMQISVGQQGYKYNPYAKNFGEYLFRSEAYPTTVRTGDWGAIDNAGAGIWGVAFKGVFLDGMLHNDFLITMANERTPLHDVSFSNITSVEFAGMVQIGGGLMLSRYLQIDPKKSRPESQATGWFEWTAADQARLSEYLRRKRAADPTFTEYSRNLVGGGTVVDTALAPGTYWAGSARDLVGLVANPVGSNDSIAIATGVNKNSGIEYIDTKAIMLVGRASFDPKPLLNGAKNLGSLDLVLYGEVAVLGSKNYPIYYTEISERMPMMAGFYLPTFKWLDYLTVEVEYFKNPHMNSDYMMAFYRIPQPKSPNAASPEIPLLEDPAYGVIDQYKVNHTEDDFKWTVTAQKSFGAWNLAFQSGKDHYRPLTGAFRPSFTEAATTKDAWYYMLRFMVNI